MDFSWNKPFSCQMMSG